MALSDLVGSQPSRILCVKHLQGKKAEHCAFAESNSLNKKPGKRIGKPNRSDQPSARQDRRSTVLPAEVSVPTRGCVDHRLRVLLKEYSKHASYMFWRFGVICNHFLVWCYAYKECPQLDPPRSDDGKKTKPSKNHNQTLFQTMTKIGMP